MRRYAPKSLAGQLALLVGIALFVAQAINFALLLSENRERRANLTVVPAVVRLVNAAERHQRQGSFPPARRARARRADISSVSGVTDLMKRDAAAETRSRAALVEAGLEVLDLRAARARRNPTDRPIRNGAGARERSAEMLVVSAQIEPATWLTVRVPLRGEGSALVWRLLGQTVVLYIVLLAAILWIGRRAARPLRALTDAATEFGMAGGGEPLPARGPGDIRALTEAFNEMRERLTTTLAEKDRMLGAIGHDLRTPLASLRLRVETHDDPDERSRLVATIAEMSQTLDDILSLSQVGRTQEPAALVDLTALADALIEDLRDLGGDVIFEESPRVVVELRPTLTRRALRNLVENALKYGVRAVVRVRAEASTVIVEVEDEGPGLPENALEEAFGSFTRLEASRNRDTGGAGLGLALARAIVRDQGGDIELENRASGGLRARVRLPTCKAR